MKNRRLTKLIRRMGSSILAIMLLVAVAIVPAQSVSASNVTGGWTVAENNRNAAIPSSAAKIFNKAMKGMTGVEYTPICYIGKQVVSGTNYYYLCRSQAVTPNSKPALKYVKIYKNLKGKLSVSISKFTLSKHAKNRSITTAQDGAVTVYSKTSAANLPKAVKKAFNRAVKGITGVGYTPVAYLGSQVVSGCNYQVLCLGTTVTRNPETHLYVLTIHDNAGSTKSTLTSVYELY